MGAATAAMDTQTRRILMGRIHGAFGVRGELKLQSFTDPPKAILGYAPWILRTPSGEERTVEGARGRMGPKGLLVTLPGIGDRDAANAMRGTEVYVPRSSLPPPGPGRYYWVDLEDLRVVNTRGVDFGHVAYLFSTGANDVLVVQGDRERMIPFLEPDYVVSVDFGAGLITVDWDADF